MTRFVHSLLLQIAWATEKELVKMIEHLKAENMILRSKLPKRIEVTPAELAKLVKLGSRLRGKLRT
jgi:putative transposase